MDIYERRRERFRALMTERYDGRQVSIADAIERQADYVNRMLSGKKRIGEELARNIESRLGLPAGWLDGNGPRPVESSTLFGVIITEAGARLGAEWDKLREPLRAQVQLLIETLVAEQKRSDRKKKTADSQPDAPRRHA